MLNRKIAAKLSELESKCGLVVRIVLLMAAVINLIWVQTLLSLCIAVFSKKFLRHFYKLGYRRIGRKKLKGAIQF